MTAIRTLIKALQTLAFEIQSPGGQANATIAEAAGRLEHLALVWTRKPPSENGWYWVRWPHARFIRVNYVSADVEWEDDIEFAGPIPLPEEQSA